MYKDRCFDKEGLDLMAKHYEARRKEKVKVLLEVFYEEKEISIFLIGESNDNRRTKLWNK